jgi:2-polyprenyl-3-methyl-5-hydroxy-6-metoxy-1,4-benzoquinol methylase
MPLTVEMMAISLLRSVNGGLENQVERALAAAEAMLEEQSSRYYFSYHRVRYKAMAMHIACKYASFDGLRVLDVGSHQLHFIAVLQLLGAQSSGIDVGVFTEAPENKQLAARLGVANHTITNLEADLAEFLHDKTYDLIVFSEILEHITFNPRKMWRAMLQSVPEGNILVTTPNAFALHKLPGYFSRLIRLQGYGIKVDEILSTMTYGHHWKEYSVTELRHYFQLLGEDVRAEVFAVQGSDDFQGSRLAAAVRGFLVWLTNRIPLLRFQIFCWVRPG